MWTKTFRAIILSALTLLSAPFASAQESSLQVQLKEVEMLAESLREENRSLQQAMAAKERELDELRSKYAELILGTDRQISEIAALQLSAAHLVLGAAGDSTGEQTQAAELMDTLALARRKGQLLLETVERHVEKVQAVVETLAPSQAVRKEVDGNLTELRERAQECVAPLMLLDAAATTTSSCSILKSDAATGIVILDRGTLHGVRSGAQFILQRGDKVAARLKVIESRPLHSAAMIVAGEKAAAVPGTLLKNAEQ